MFVFFRPYSLFSVSIQNLAETKITIFSYLSEWNENKVQNSYNEEGNEAKK